MNWQHLLCSKHCQHLKMTKRSKQTNWVWYMLVFCMGTAWSAVKGVALPDARDRSSLIETQAKFFQDFFSVQLSPYKIEFGHVCEDPNTWEQRYEKKDYKNHRDMGKVRWGDKKGGYGEHYWDLNHAGHSSDHDNGDYHSNNHDHDSYHEPSEESAKYEADDKTEYEESERTKRGDGAKAINDFERRGLYSANYRNNHDQGGTIAEEKRRSDKLKPREKNHIVLVVNHKDRGPSKDNVRQFVPYENGSGVRRHQGLEISASESVPRLFFESSTGRVIDRTTGQAYVLQPVNVSY